MAASLTRAHGSGWMCHARLQMALGTGRFRASSQFGSGHWRGLFNLPPSKPGARPREVPAR